MSVVHKSLKAPVVPATHESRIDSREVKSATPPGSKNTLPLQADSFQSSSIPAWYPSDFDLSFAAAGSRRLLESQGEKPETMGPGQADRIIFSDADLTLLQTRTPILFKHKTTGDYLKNPDTGRLMLVAGGKSIGELKQAYPQVSWNDYEVDFREHGSYAELLRTPEIQKTVDTLRASDSDPRSRDFVITARSDELAATAVDDYLSLRGVDINGAVAVNVPEMNGEAGVPVELESGQKKALHMAGLIALYPDVKSVKFMDDGDANLGPAMQLLPALFPDKKFEFEDVVHVGNMNFQHVLVAKSSPDQHGTLEDPMGQPFDAEDIARCRSNDARLPMDPIFSGG